MFLKQERPEMDDSKGEEKSLVAQEKYQFSILRKYWEKSF